MSMTLATLVILAVQVYMAAGLMLGVGFLLFRIERADPAACGAHAFRPLLLPGLILLWPLVAWRLTTDAR
jgi:hypothetical protein